MTTKLPRHIAEAAVEQIRLMFPGFVEEKGFGKPELHEDEDHWTVRWDEGPYLFGEYDFPAGMPPGVPAATDWPTGVKAVTVDKQIIALYADEN